VILSNELPVDVRTLQTQVREKYRDVANDPHRAHHFHTGRPLATRLGDDDAIVDQLPDRAVYGYAFLAHRLSAT